MMSTSLYTLLFAFFAVAFAGNGTSTYTYQHQGSTAFHLDLGLNTTGNDLYFNMSAPSTYSWLAFGIGGQMKNSFMFIGYPSSNGSGKEILPDIVIASRTKWLYLRCNFEPATLDGTLTTTVHIFKGCPSEI
ncbi:hypothetical protein KCU79_g3584, partial [Aureobasidium melanogenum]